MMGSNTQNRKNASGNRSDIGWEHGIEVENNPRKIKCKYCNEIIPGNIYRFKHHLACTRKDVKACNNVPVEVKEQMSRLLKESPKRKMINDEEEEMVESVSHKRGREATEFFSNRMIGTTQSSPNQNFEKRLRDETCQQIARFFHTSGIPFSCAENPEFAKMLELVGKCGSEFVPPSYHELKNSSVENEMKIRRDMLEEYKYEWKNTGCSIICDEWTNIKGMFCCNFLVNSSAGTIFLKTIDTSDFSETIGKIFEVLDEIVEKVGEENVVQVITNNSANYKAAVDMLIKKRIRIFWSPCIIQSLDEILRDFENNITHHQKTIAKGKKISTFIYSRPIAILMLRDSTNGKELTGPTTSPAATAYLTLLYLIDMKDNLLTMFSSEWESEEEVKEIQQIVQDSRFWDDIADCLNVALPIIEVLLKIESDEKPDMGFIYGEMKRATESIKSLHNAKEYESICDIITERWAGLLHPLVIASYYLNPQFYYGPSFQIGDVEEPDAHILKLLDCVNFEMTEEKLLKIKQQLAEFSIPKGLFATQAAMLARHKKDPAKWWDSYGNDCPELQRIAIRLLSLTCSSCGSGQVRNAYEQVYPKEKSPSYQKQLNGLFSIIQNFKSNTRQARTKTFESINPEVSSSGNKLIIEREVGQVSGAKKDMLVDANVDEDVSEGVPLTGNYSGNEVDTSDEDVSEGVPLTGNYNGNEIGTVDKDVSKGISVHQRLLQRLLLQRQLLQSDEQLLQSDEQLLHQQQLQHSSSSSTE